MTANDSKSYLPYLKKNGRSTKTYHHSIGKKPINADYSVVTEKIERNLKAPKCTVNDRAKIIEHKNKFSKGCTKNWSKEIFIIDSVLKTNSSTCKIKDLNGEKNRRLLWKIIYFTSNDGFQNMFFY